LTGVAAFVQAAEAGSFALAARRMNLSRSAVGKTIARLEERLGVRLFHRTTRRQSLTADGQSFYERCVRALSELEAAEAELESGRREPSGRLRVTAPVLVGRHCVAPVLFRLLQDHPGLELEMIFTDQVVDLVEERFDLAVRVGALANSTNLMARRLGALSMAICAAPSYLAKHGRPTSAEDFERHSAIVYARPDCDKPWRVTAPDGSTHDLRAPARLRLDDVQAILDAAVAGAGLARLPCGLMAQELRTGQLELVIDSRQVLSTEIHVVWPRSLQLPVKTRLAIDALVSHTPGLLSR
jgi:DNA-binding transcriptional LysR family regulator